MSADTAVLYRDLDDGWYVLSGAASCDYSDGDFRARGTFFRTLGEADEFATSLLEDDYFEHGMIYDPSPPVGT